MIIYLKEVVAKIHFQSLHNDNGPLSYLKKGLDRALFLNNFILDVRSSGVRASITILHIRNPTKYSKISFDCDSFQNS